MAKSKRKPFTFGSDPEFMLVRDGKHYSAIEILKQSKDNKIKLNGFEFYYDNVMAEASIPPSNSKSEAIETLGKMLASLAGLVVPYKIACQASVDFPEDQLQSKEAKAIGCTPELCAYQLETVIPPAEQFSTGTLRTSGGHIHIGAKIAQDMYGLLHVIRLLDLFLGIPSTLIDKDPTSKRRKQLYGAAGRFRQPDYGCEYRSIGNFWLTSPALVSLIYDITEFTVNFVQDGRQDELWNIDIKKLEDDATWADINFHPSSCHKCIGYDIKELRSAIDTMDIEKAKSFMPLIARYMPSGLFSDIEKAIANAKLYDPYKEWKL